jgi:hypothetical protein
MIRPPSPQLFFATLLLAGALLAGGCASVYEVTVDATVQATGISSPRTSFRIHDPQAGPGPRTLRHQEIASQIKTALSAQGLYEAPDVESADIVVEISYGIEPPRVQRIGYQEFIYGRPVPATERQALPPEGVAREMMGYTAIASVIVVREKHLSICARQNSSRESAQPAADIWRVHVSLENESDDLRRHLPILASAAMDHLGRSTNGPAKLTLRSNDEAVRFIRDGL